MKKLFLIILMMPLMMAVHAQKIQWSGYAGYTIPAVLKVNKGKYKVEQSPNCGIFVSLAQPKLKVFKGTTFIEMQYNHQRSDLWYHQYNIDSNKALGKVNVSTLMAGISTEITDTWFRPFVGVLIGATVVDPSGAPDITRFTMSFMGGAKIPFSKNVGLRLQAQLMMPNVYRDTDVGFDPSFGVANGVAPNTVVLYTDFSGGIYIQF